MKLPVGPIKPVLYCGERFLVEVVRADIASEDLCDLSMACPACVANLGTYRPDKFPTIEEYEAAKRRFSDRPIWGSIEEASGAWEVGKPYHEALAASQISR